MRILASLVALAASVSAVLAQPVPPSRGGDNLNPAIHDIICDSRCRDAYVSTGPQSGTQATNWLVQAIALSGNRIQLGVNAGGSGCRSDQYFSQANLDQVLQSSSGWIDIGYGIINDIAPQNGNVVPVNLACTGNAVGTFPYTNNNGVSVNLSNLARVAAGNLNVAVQQMVRRGKIVTIAAEPGNAAINNTPVTVVSFNGQIAATTLTVNSITSGTVVWPRQSLTGSGVSAGTVIVAQLTGAGGANCPTPGVPDAAVCNGGVGTYQLNNSFSIAAEAMTGTYTTIAAVDEYNGYARALAASYPGQVYFWSANPVLHNPTGSATAVTFRANCLIDNVTHFNNNCGYYAATQYLATFQSLFPAPDLAIADINDIYTANPRQLINNPLFNTTTGGTVSTCTVSGGNATPPAGWTVTCNSASTTITMTTVADTSNANAANGSGFGNCFQILAVPTGADVVHLQSNANLAQWNLTDWLQTGVNAIVAAGSSHLSVYANTQIATNAGTLNDWAAWGAAPATGGGTNDGPTVGYTYGLLTPPAQVLPNSTSKSFLVANAFMGFSAADTATVKWCRASSQRIFQFNPATNSFSGWLLLRDLDGGNDNFPAFLRKAA